VAHVRPVLHQETRQAQGQVVVQPANHRWSRTPSLLTRFLCRGWFSSLHKNDFQKIGECHVPHSDSFVSWVVVRSVV
jgi:hypothetical protein